jgi:predicted dehydrogenase
MDSGAHFCDTVRYLFGEVESCYGRVLHLGTHKARRGDELVDITSEDTFFATLNFANGAVGSWSIAWALPGHPLSAVVYYGSEGAIVEPRDPFHGPSIQSQVVLRDGTSTPLETYYQEYLQALGPAGRQREFPHGITDGYTLEIYDFLTAVRDGRPPEIDGEQGMRAKAIALTIYESATTGQAVRVADVLAGRAREYQRPIDARWGL